MTEIRNPSDRPNPVEAEASERPDVSPEQMTAFISTYRAVVLKAKEAGSKEAMEIGGPDEYSATPQFSWGKKDVPEGVDWEPTSVRNTLVWGFEDGNKDNELYAWAHAYNEQGLAGSDGVVAIFDAQRDPYESDYFVFYSDGNVEHSLNVTGSNVSPSRLDHISWLNPEETEGLGIQVEQAMNVTEANRIYHGTED